MLAGRRLNDRLTFINNGGL